jgi:outer membrane protein TolC
VLDWRFETAGKRGHRIDQAQAQALSARLALHGEVAHAHAEISRALLAQESAATAVNSLAHQHEAADALADLWRKRVAAGAASRVDALPVETARLDATRALAEQQRGEAEARSATAAAVGIPRSELDRVALRPPGETELGPFAQLERQAALDRALLTRSDVLGALADYSATEAALALEVARQYPDVTLGPGFQWDQGQRKWQIGISLDLPLLDRNAGPIAEAEAARSEAAAHLMAVQAGAITEIETALARRDGRAAERDALRALANRRAENAAHAEHALRLGASTRAEVLAARLDALRSERARDEADLAWRGALVDLAAALEATPFDPEKLEAWLRERDAR